MFRDLKKLMERPKPFEHYTSEDLWNDDHISKKMLELHLDENIDLASRKGEFIERSAEWIIREFKLGKGKKVCDFGCGPGLYTTIFARSGAEVTGIDLSRRSIEYARRRSEEQDLNIDYIEGNYLDFRPYKRFDHIVMIFCDFCVLSPVQRRKLLSIFHDHLEDDGCILFDVSSPALLDSVKEDMIIEHSEKDGFWSYNPYFMIKKTFLYGDLLLLNKHTIIQEIETREIYNWFQCYTVDSITDLLNECGFAVMDIYGNVAGDDYRESRDEFAVKAKKIH